MKKPAQKLAIFISPQRSLWVSCNSIGPNLVRSYEMLAKESSQFSIEWFPISRQQEQLELRLGTGYFVELAEKIIRSRVTDLIFLDHQINPLPILMALKTCLGAKFRTYRFCFHIYGDFTLFPQRWLDIGNILDGSKTKWLCASDRQKELVSFFERSEKTATAVCPFPVNTKKFQFSEKYRREVREKFGLREDQTLLLYTGRLSLQKCIVRLIEEFEKLCKKRSNLHLALAGPYDNLGGLTSGIAAPPGFYFHELQEKLTSLPKKVREKIIFAGDLPHEELKKVYSAADLFVSLSLHHDEDFGMCPAEAFSSGLPSILSDWGGYASFKTEGVPCELVPVRLGKRGLEMDGDALWSLLEQGIQKRHSFEERARSGQAFAKKFGIAAVAKILKSHLLAESYESIQAFDWSLEMLSRQGVLKGDMYNDVYQRYVDSSAN